MNGLTVGRTYGFSVWISRWTPNSTSNGAASAKLQALANGAVIASFLDTDTETSGVWTKRSGTFTANSTSVALQIRDLENASFGNDFAIDDISVQAVPEPSALRLGAAAFVRRRKRA